ncbi:MAG TPA: hypothetical protein VNR36_10940 [Pseudolysinimonas sp.]|nr:hypothetical protein [Pseudolysinimonas sp.]
MTAGVLTEFEPELIPLPELDDADPDPIDVDCTEHPGCRPIA